MGRSPCCDKVGLKKGTWTAEEDQKLLTYIEQHGHGTWRGLPEKAGLKRCGKSCRLRWTNYLRPDIKRGRFSAQDEQTIIQLHALLGNRWSAIAAHLPKRTDNEIKNYWNTHLKKRLAKMGIDPATHKPKAHGSSQSKDTANISHMAQWESARLEAEARLVRQSKLMSSSIPHPTKPTNFLPPCLDILKVWQATRSTAKSTSVINPFFNSNGTLQSPTSTLNFSDNMFNVPRAPNFGENVAFPLVNYGRGIVMKDNVPNNWKSLGMDPNHDGHQQVEVVDNAIMLIDHHHDIEYPNPVDDADAAYTTEESLRHPSFMESFAVVLFDDGSNNSTNLIGDDLEEDKKYWNDILSNAVTFTSGSSSIF